MLQEKQDIALCNHFSLSILTYIALLCTITLIYAPSLLPREAPSVQLSVTHDATVSCVKDGCETNVRFVFYCVIYSLESQKIATNFPIL